MNEYHPILIDTIQVSTIGCILAKQSRSIPPEYNAYRSPSRTIPQHNLSVQRTQQNSALNAYNPLINTFHNPLLPFQQNPALTGFNPSALQYPLNPLTRFPINQHNIPPLNHFPALNPLNQFNPFIAMHPLNYGVWNPYSAVPYPAYASYHPATQSAFAHYGRELPSAELNSAAVDPPSSAQALQSSASIGTSNSFKRSPISHPQSPYYTRMNASQSYPSDDKKRNSGATKSSSGAN